jgi:predicted GH43/DUF377 family glycosyl hydrolase
MKRTAAVFAAFLVLAGCSKYRDFTLPAGNDVQSRGPESRGSDVKIAWEVRKDPVLFKGSAGEFDSIDALNPSVVRTAAGYFNFYSGYDGKTWHTGLAVSPDGVVWTKRGRVMSPDPAAWEGSYIAANGSVLEVDGAFWHWYQGGRIPRIGLARSRDGVAWRKESGPVLPAGPAMSWDERGIADPYVVRIAGNFYMYYLGQDRARRQRLGVAMSQDGIEWHKLRTNPILELGEIGAFDEVGLGEPAVWSQHGSYWMLYTGRNRKEIRRVGLARSQDGVRWMRVPSAPLLAGREPWNSSVVCDPSVEVSGEEVRVWFGGGNRPEPAENLNGQIGLATMRIATVR